MAGRIKISPSVLAANFARLGDEAAAMRKAGADMLHLDVMDGNFVPNISFGPPVIASLRKECDIFFDVHLMISRPLDYISVFRKAGADMITFHIESESDPVKTLAVMRANGVKRAIAIKPGTAAEDIKRFLPELDMVLVMTVEPGFGGQKFMQEMLPKIRQLREWADETNPDLDIQVDGGIDNETARLVTEAGANVLVAGSSLFGCPDYAAAISGLKLDTFRAVDA